MSRRIVRRSFRRAGRLVPRRARGLRARSVVLARSASMPWHSTDRREELLIILEGRVQLETQRARAPVRVVPLRAGECVFLPVRTVHQVVNHSRRRAQYVYVTAPSG